MTVRPEEFTLARGDSGWSGTVKSRVFLGRFINYEVIMPNGIITEISLLTTGMHDLYSPGEKVSMTVDENRINVFNEDGTQNLIKERELYE